MPAGHPGDLDLPPRRTKPKRARAFLCPKCHVPLQVAYTRNLSSEIVRRCRECPACDHVVITEERPRSTGV